MAKHFAQDVDYIGTIANNLRDLEGKETLAFELIQNADDDASADFIRFNVTEEALIVENNGQFTDCGQIGEDSCPFEQKNGFQCDFHRFRELASRGKRREENTAGAFGIGFISVYQITDRPELRSGNRHWEIQPDAERDKRIRQERLDSSKDGTQFYLPWAKDPESELRQALDADSISDSYPEELTEKLASVLPQSLLFLRNLTSIELCRNHETVLKVRRRSRGNRREIVTERDGEQKSSSYITQKWNFSSEANRLIGTSNSGNQEKKSKHVEIAIPIDDASEAQEEGRYYAYLPTRHSTGLPFHVQADFFPSSDRRRIVFDGEFKNEWNRLATRQSYDAFLSLLPRLKEEMQPSQFVKTLNGVYQSRNSDGDSGNGPSPECWKKLKPHLQNGQYVFTEHERWRRAGETYLPRKSTEQIERLADVLDILDLEVPVSEIRSYQNLLQEIGSRRLTLPVVIERLESIDIEDGTPKNDAPDWMQDPLRYAAVFQLVGKLYQGLSSADEELEERLRKLPLALSTNGQFHAFENVKRVRCPDYLGPLSQLNSTHLFLDPDLSPELLDFIDDAGLVEELKIGDVHGILRSLPVSVLEDQWTDSSSSLVQLIRGLLDQDVLSGDHKEDDFEKDNSVEQGARNGLQDLPIWPVGEEYGSLDNVVIPGGFEDPLEVSRVLAGPAARTVGRKVENVLDVPRLDFERYVTEELPRAFNEETIRPETCRKTVELLSKKLGELKGIEEARGALSGCSVVLCEDGKYRPPEEVYFEGPKVRQILGEEVPRAAEDFPHPAAATLYEEIGVASAPRPEDVVKRIKEIIQAPPSGSRRRQIKDIVHYLSEHRSNSLEEFEDLKDLKWLPIENDEENWHSPGEVYTPGKKHLFYSQGQFIDVRNRVKARPVFRFLGLDTNPSTKKIVDHLLHCARREQPPEKPTDIYEELSTRLQNESGTSEKAQVRRLRGEQVLYVHGHGFCQPDHVFQSKHPFGRFRHHVKGRSGYSAFLNCIGVKQGYDEEDAVAVLMDIASGYREGGGSLRETDKSVLLKCWKVCAEEGMSAKLADRLEEKQVVLTAEGSLVKPEGAFFDDHPSLPSSIEEFFEGHLVKRDRKITEALQEAGVRSVQDVLSSQLAENPHAKFDEQTDQRVHRRERLIQRVLSGESTGKQPTGKQPTGKRREDGASPIGGIEVFRASRLSVVMKASALGEEVVSEPEFRKAYLHSESNQLYVTAEDGSPKWIPVARELASFLIPREEPAQLASHLGHVLRPPSPESAEKRLDELGFPEVENRAYERVRDGGAASLEGRAESDKSPGSNASGVGSEDLPNPDKNGQKMDAEQEADVEDRPSSDGESDDSSPAGTGPASGSFSEQERSGTDRDEQAKRSQEDSKTRSESASVGASGSETSPAGEDRSSKMESAEKTESAERKAGGSGTGAEESELETTSNRSGSGSSGHGYRDVKLRSYVRSEPSSQRDGNSQNDGKQNNERNEEINRAGVETVLAHERDKGRVPEEQEHYNEGYDIESFDEEGNLLRYIEVKSTDGPWDGYGVGLSSAQFEMAQKRLDDYWLYVVDYALSESPDVFCIQNPWSKVSEYLFDDEWQKLSERNHDRGKTL